LPFTNMSGDPDQEYFSDGITEDIITELSRYRSLHVIARNSSFAFKGKAAKIQDIARELGVGYVVEGSVRKAPARIRVTAQLIEAVGGTHLWTERYTDQRRSLRDQDEVCAGPATRSGDSRRQGPRACGAARRGLSTYECCAATRCRSATRGRAVAHQLFEQAVALVLTMHWRTRNWPTATPSGGRTK
jgi:TolB-like protein